MDPTAQQGRVLACLIEKAATTPDSYPLSSNALTAACNQSSNRDPVVDYTEREIDATMLQLREMGLARTVTGSGHRVGKHKHIADEALGLDGHGTAVLAVLILRGAQTLHEITTRTERYTEGPGGDSGAVDTAIDRLAARAEPLAVRLERRPGEREPRIDQCWVTPHDPAPPTSDHPAASPDEPTLRDASPPPAAPTPRPAAASRDSPSATAAPTSASSDLEARVTALEAALGEQSRRLDELLEQLGD